MDPRARTGAFFALGAAAACSGAGEPLAGSGGGATTTTTLTTTTSSTTIVTTTGGGGSAGAGGTTPFVCDPPAAPGSLYELSVPSYDLGAPPVSMCQYRGDVALIVNTAAL